MENAVKEEKDCQWEVDYNFKEVPAGEFRDLVFESQAPGLVLERREYSTGLSFDLPLEAYELTFWVLMPTGREYQDWRIYRHKKGETDSLEAVKAVTEYWAGNSTILAFKLLTVKPGYSYEILWYYK